MEVMELSRASHESSLLLTLEEISQLVAHSHDPAETLGNIVRLIQRRFHTDVCSVYLLEPERGELVLGATVGLRPESVGRVRMRLEEGLTGLVAERLAPVMVDDACRHARFKYFPEAGEDPYHSFLGVPLVEGGALQGVLVVQTVEPRTFSTNEMRMLVTVASQLAPLVGGARFLECVAAAAHAKEPAAAVEVGTNPSCFRGNSLSPGVGWGEAFLLNGFDTWQDATRQGTVDPGVEKQRLAASLEAARLELTRLSQHISELVGQDHGAILQAQLMLMQDRTIERDLADCLAAGSTAEGALLQVLDKYVAALGKLSTPFWQERTHDIKDVFRRVLWHLRPRAPAGRGAGRLVLVAVEASVMDLFSVDLDRLAAVVVERGGPQGHAAILARSLGVPMVSQIADPAGRIRPGRELLVDGAAGLVWVDPSAQGLAVSPPAVVPAPASVQVESARASHPRLEANINLLREVGEAVAQRAAGVGLYRSEFLFLARRTWPTEAEQVNTYSRLLTLLSGRPASIRTFDLRPDKVAHGAQLASAMAGALDWRRVLEVVPLQKLFKEQVRAILRAAVVGPARILVPFVTSSELMDFVTGTVAEAREELLREGLELPAKVPVGIMIEVAAAATMVADWAEPVDFVAVGTNDLVASALGLDRDELAGPGQADPLHPGVLRLLHELVTAAHGAGRHVTVCGEMASDPAGALALAALGVDSLSVAVRRLSAARQALGDCLPRAIEGLAPEILRLRSAEDVRTTIAAARAGTPAPHALLHFVQ
jgi:phosphotransferase system enzyme I (PtsP)